VLVSTRQSCFRLGRAGILHRSFFRLQPQRPVEIADAIELELDLSDFTSESERLG